MVYEIVVLTLLLPAIVSAAVVFVELLAGGWRPADDGADRGARLAGGFAAAGSFLLAYGLFSWTELDPSDHWHWIPQAVVALTLAALLAGMAGRAWACALVVVAALVFAWLMTPAWEEVVHIRPWAAMGLAAAILVYLGLALPLKEERRASPDWLIGVVLTLHLVAATVVIERSGWASLAQLSVLPIVVFGVLTLASWLYPRRQFLYGAMPTFAVVFPATLLLAWYYTYSPISLWACALPAIGPFALLVVLAATKRLSHPAQTAALWSVLVFPLGGTMTAFATA